MPPPLERIHFPQSLREVQLRAVATPPGSEHDQAEYERGRQEGEKALREELIRQRTELLEAQNGVLASLRQALPQVVRECETGLVALAIEVAQKLVSGLPISHEMVEANLREALAQAEEAAEFQIHLHPQDLELLQGINSPLLPGQGAWEKMTLHSSSEVSRGGCLVQTRFGIVDARRETKLALLKESLAA